MNTHHPNSPSLPPRSLNIPQFANDATQLNGSATLAALPRLQQATPHAQPDTVAQWQAHGRTKPVPESAAEIWLDIQAQVQLPFTCQRCLQHMEETIAINRSIRFVQDEATAAELDETIEADVLVHSTQFDLLELIEDELIMALPYAPKHASCTHEPSTALKNQADEAHPFAALQQLKKQ